MSQNKAWFSKDKLNTTMFQYPLTAPKFTEGKKYAWKVISESGTRSESDVFSFSITGKSMMGGANVDFKLDTIYCTSTVGNLNYYHIRATYKNLITSANNILINDNGSFPGNTLPVPSGTGYNLQNNIRTKGGAYNAALLIQNILESNNGAISGFTPAPGSFIGSLTPGNGITFDFNFVTSASTVQFIFYGLVDDALKAGTNKNSRNEILTINKFPACPCNPCKGKTTTFGSAASSQTTFQNNGSVSVNSTVTHTPNQVIKVTAQIVDVERMGEAACLLCTKESKEFGNFTGGILNNNSGNILNGGIGYGKQIQWKYNTPTLINNFSYNLQMMFPPLTAVSCCKDSIRICTRWSFTDKDCITCDTFICSIIRREYVAPTGPIFSTINPYAAQIAKMGEPYLSWFNQKSDELPENFKKQIQDLRNIKTEDKALNDEDFEQDMKSTFFTLRGLKSSNTDAVWNVMNGKHNKYPMWKWRF